MPSLRDSLVRGTSVPRVPTRGYSIACRRHYEEVALMNVAEDTPQTIVPFSCSLHHLRSSAASADAHLRIGIGLS